MADFVKDPRMQQLLEQLINRPETVSSMDVQEEDMQDVERMKLEQPESEEYQMPEDIEESVGQVQESSDKMISGLPNKSFQQDTEVTKMLRKLKSGQPSTEDVEVAQEDLEDPSMDSELRRAALQKIKQKYLGQ